MSAAIAADNVVVALYFAFLFYLAVPGEDKSETVVTEQTTSSALEDMQENRDGNEVMTMQSLAVSIAVASCLVTIGKVVTGAILPTGTSVSDFIWRS